ncbi:TPA: DUF4435 domain-containing protein [Bacillus cereus]|nr:hypothetical protein CN415_24625 [Bacillus cereus]
MDSLSFPSYSPEALLSSDLFFGEYNDVMIFMEDTKGLHIYEALLPRLFDNQVEFNYIHATGGKKNLKELFERYIEMDEETEIPYLFIADLDFDLIKGEELISHEAFVYLDRYSIESYLVDELVGAKFINGRTSEGVKVCKQKLKFENWLASIQNDYKRILVLFSIVQLLELGVRNADLKCFRFKKDRGWDIDQDKVNSYFKEVYLKYREMKKFGFSKAYQFVNKNIEDHFSSDAWRIIPGRQLLGLFEFYVSNFIQNPKPVSEDFLNFAAETCDVSNMLFLRRRIEKVLENAKNQDEVSTSII